MGLPYWWNEHDGAWTALTPRSEPIVLVESAKTAVPGKSELELQTERVLALEAEDREALVRGREQPPPARARCHAGARCPGDEVRFVLHARPDARDCRAKAVGLGAIVRDATGGHIYPRVRSSTQTTTRLIISARP